ncbi:MAG: NYN domain-containing protein [bacterium]|nr:NYN domain-containing protein [bacterium]
MAYLIDGHNLIGQLPDIQLSDPHDEAKLVIKLRGFAARTNKKVIVVFDNGIPAGVSSMSNGAVEVLFASPGSTADAIMRARILSARDPGFWLVVSGDNQVLAAARQRKMRALKSAEFVRELNLPARKRHDKDSLLDQVEVKGKRKPKQRDTLDVYVSPKEVEAWLKEFGEEP